MKHVSLDTGVTFTNGDQATLLSPWPCLITFILMQYYAYGTTLAQFGPWAFLSIFLMVRSVEFYFYP